MPRLRGLLHLHSTLSDGFHTPAQLRDLAEPAGYSFVVLCEHTKRLPRERRSAAAAQCRAASDDGFACIFALECSFEGRHVLLLGPEDLLREADDEVVVLTPERVREAGGLTIWAHPAATSFWTMRRGAAADYDGWEVWNQYTDGPVPSFPVLAMLRRLRNRGRNLLAFGGTDYHDPIRHTMIPALEVELPDLGPAALIESLRAGNFTVVRDTSSHVRISSTGEAARPRLRSRAYAAARFTLLRLRSLVVFVVRAARRRTTPARPTSPKNP